MSILKFENRTPKALSEMIDYLTDKSKTTEEGIFGIGCNPHSVVAEFEFVQRMFFKENITHPYLQIIFSFDWGINIPLEVTKEICIEIAKVLLIDSRQIFGAIHYLDTDHVHCHYLLNSIGVDGTLYKQKYSVWTYKKRVNKILNRYGLNEIKIYEAD